MNNSSPYDHMPDGYAEEKPFYMSPPDQTSLAEIEEQTGSLLTSPRKAESIPFPRNQFFGGVCLALPFSALLWLLIIYVL